MFVYRLNPHPFWPTPRPISTLDYNLVKAITISLEY